MLNNINNNNNNKNYLVEKWNWPTNEKKVFSLLDIHISMMISIEETI